MKLRQYRYTIAFVLLLAAVVYILMNAASAYGECEKNGGVYVSTSTGWQCLDVEEKQ